MCLIIFLILFTGCTPICSPGQYDRVSKDKFAYFEQGKPKYVIQERGYDSCNSVTTINQIEVNREVWEGME